MKAKVVKQQEDMSPYYRACDRIAKKLTPKTLSS